MADLEQTIEKKKSSPASQPPKCTNTPTYQCTSATTHQNNGPGPLLHSDAQSSNPSNDVSLFLNLASNAGHIEQGDVLQPVEDVFHSLVLNKH